MYKKINNKYIIFTLLLSLILWSCSSDSSNNKQKIPLTAPNDFVITGKNNELSIQFTKIAGIGSQNKLVNPTYEVSIGTTKDINHKDTVTFNPIEGNPDTNLMRFSIKKEVDKDDKNIVFTYDKLENEKTFYVFISALYNGYGKSKVVIKEGVPIPNPKEISGFKVETGDKRVVVSWNNNKYEEYYAHFNDCPKTYENKNMNQNEEPFQIGDTPFWKPVNLVNGNKLIINLDKNDDNSIIKGICVIPSNANGFGNWYVDSASQNENGDITYNQHSGKAATSAVAPFDIEINKNNLNERIEIKFKPVLIGEASVAEYKFLYKEESEQNYKESEPIEINSLDENGYTVATLPKLVNGKKYKVKLKAYNSVSTQGVESSNEVIGDVQYVKPNFNNPNEFLGVAKNVFIFAEDIPHSDFTRATNNNGVSKRGGRPSTDRLTRGKETAIGSLFSEAVLDYAIKNNKQADFSFLIGSMVTNGLLQNQNITINTVNGLIDTDFLDDTLVIVNMKGSDIISNNDLNIDIENSSAYPKTVSELTSLLGQAAYAYRAAHYGRGHKNFSGAHWGMPSNNLKYTIQYKEYLFKKPKDDTSSKVYFVDNFKTNCADYNINTGLNSSGVAYDGVQDSNKCYLLEYSKAKDDDPNEVITYKRGKIERDSVMIKNQAGVFEKINPDKEYRVVTTKEIVNRYPVFLRLRQENTDLKLKEAIYSYIYNKGQLYTKDFLTGKVKLKGGVPGNSDNDFKESK